MKVCYLPYGKDVYELQRINVECTKGGALLRWYYNGWHYWNFRIGREVFQTAGRGHGKTGSRGMQISSGQIDHEQMTGVRTIMLSREIYLLDDTGWATVYLEPSANIVGKNYMRGYELIFMMFIGACSGGETLYIPSSPHVPAEFFKVGKNNIYFMGDDSGQESAQAITVFAPSKEFSVIKHNLDWLVVLNLVGKLVVYPTSVNTGYDREGVIELSLGGFSPVFITVKQFAGTAQVFEANKQSQTFNWDYYGAGIEAYILLTVAPDKEVTVTNTIPWVNVSVNQSTKIVSVYPTSKNDGIERTGQFTLSVSGAADIVIDVTQFGIPEPDSPKATAASDITPTTFRANWNYSHVAERYYIDVSKYEDFSSFVLQNFDVGGSLSFVVLGLNAETNYYYRVRADNISGTSYNSNVISVKTGDAIIEVSVDYVVFDSVGNPCFTDTITITTSGPWTASWVLGNKFTASRMSGSSGQSTTISCVEENMSGTPYQATLRITSYGRQKEITVIQYRVGMPCPS
ncbi:MAG: hypothetical protein WDA29_10460 [Flavobacteriaceae bacterium]|jgi:hypothetical protein